MASKTQSRREIEGAVRARMIQVREDYQNATKAAAEAKVRFEAAHAELNAVYLQANQLSNHVAMRRAELAALEAAAFDAYQKWAK